MTNRKYKKIVFGVLLAALILGIQFGNVLGAEKASPVPPKDTSAETAKNAGTIIYVITNIVGWALSFTANLVDFAIKLGNEVLKLPAVTTGWQIVLSFTNLGFVLGIIVIAFATILRMESYGMKQILWKLVVAALLVNFSLVIAGAFISMSNTITNVFIEATVVDNLGNALGNAMQPQKLIEVENPSLLAIAGDIFSYFIKYIFSLLFAVVFSFLTVLAFLTLFIMLLARVIALAFLLIVSPLVWLLWIFPATNKYWQQWWSEFLRWNFFAPAVLFFVYLTIITAKNIGDVGSVKSVSNNDAAKAFKAGLFLGNEAIQHAANLFILLGLLFGGIYVANKFGIAGGSIGVNLAQRAGKAVGGWAGRKGKQYGTAPFRARLWKDEEGKRTKSLGGKAVEWSSKMGWLGRHTFGYAARGITRLETAGGENILKEHKKAVGNMSDADVKASILTTSGPRKIVVMQELQKRKLLGDVDAKNLITEGNKSLFGRFRQGVLWGDVEHGAKMDTKIAEELRKTGKATPESLGKFVKTYKGKDIEASAIKDLYKGEAKLGLTKGTIAEFSEMFADALAAENYQMTPKIVPTMNAKERANFLKIYGEFDRDGNIISGAVTVPGRERAKEAWKNTMSNYAMGFSAEAPPTATTPPPIP